MNKDARMIGRPYPAMRRTARALALALAAPVLAATAQEGPPALTADMLEDLAAMSEAAGFARPDAARPLVFPADHGAHPDMRSETWSIVTHLTDAAGRPLGLAFSLSRYGLRQRVAGPSWGLDAVTRGHAMLTDPATGAARTDERLSRGAGASGHDAAARAVWIDEWQLGYGSGTDGRGLSLSLRIDGEPVTLVLTPAGPAANVGGGADVPLRGYAMARMAATGTIGGRAVTGHAWLDRAWGDLPAPGGPLAYVRLTAHLDDGANLSVLRTARRDGRSGATLDGGIAGPDGTARALSDDAVEMTANGDEEQPLDWTLSGDGLDLRIAPLQMADGQGDAVPVTQALVSIDGTRDGVPVSGLGTLQLTGFDGP